MKKSKVTPGSLNVFADLGLPDPEVRLLKSELAHTIMLLIEEKGLTQIQAAEALGIDQPKISALLRGRLAGFSTDRLLRYINTLGCDVELRLTRKSGARRASTRVVRGQLAKPTSRRSR